jgi:hypothetical protein
MSKRYVLANAMLAAATVEAPHFLTVILLPLSATLPVRVSRRDICLNWSDLS